MLLPYLRRQVLMYSPAQVHHCDCQQSLPSSAVSCIDCGEVGKDAGPSCEGFSIHVKRKVSAVYRLSPCFMSHPVRSAPCQNSTSPVKLLFPFPNRLLRAVPIPVQIADNAHHRRSLRPLYSSCC